MTVLYDVREAVATITLNRPDTMNSLTAAMRAELLVAVERARDDGEADLQDECVATADHANATSAFLRKEQPVFHAR